MTGDYDVVTTLPHPLSCSRSPELLACVCVFIHLFVLIVSPVPHCVPLFLAGPTQMSIHPDFVFCLSNSYSFWPDVCWWLFSAWSVPPFQFHKTSLFYNSSEPVAVSATLPSLRCQLPWAALAQGLDPCSVYSFLASYFILHTCFVCVWWTHFVFIKLLIVTFGFLYHVLALHSTLLRAGLWT